MGKGVRKAFRDAFGQESLIDTLIINSSFSIFHSQFMVIKSEYIYTRMGMCISFDH